MTLKPFTEFDNGRIAVGVIDDTVHMRPVHLDHVEELVAFLNGLITIVDEDEE